MESKRNTMNRNGESWGYATIKGALIWGSVYSTASAGSAYLLIPVNAEGATTFFELLKNALLFFPFAGAFRGALMWRVRNGYHAFRFGMKKGA